MSTNEALFVIGLILCILGFVLIITSMNNRACAFGFLLTVIGAFIMERATTG